MRLRGTIVFLMLLGLRALSASAAESAIEFTGVLVADGKTKLALTEKASGTTKWIEPGAVFNGYTLANYNAKEDAITVKKDGQEFRLPLVSAKTAPKVVIPAPVVTNVVTPAPVVTTPVSSPNGNPTSPNANLVSSNPAPIATEPASEPAPLPLPAAAPASNPSSFPVASGVSTVTPAATTDVPLTPTGPVTADASAGYTIQVGDTFAKISGTTGVSMGQLQALNPGVNPGALKAGQTIRTR